MNEEKDFVPRSLAVVATPLGNPGDITARAARILALADLVAAEDTRDAGRLLNSLGVRAKLVSYHDWNEAARAEWLLEKLGEGLRVALVTDAGTPCISDPGFDLVRAAREKGFKVLPVPGPSALTAFLSVSGLPTDAFTFLGFPPPKSSKRKTFFRELACRTETLVFYESPHRVVETVRDAREVLGNRISAFGREMTKTFEEFYYGDLDGMILKLSGNERPRGEFVLGIRGSDGKRQAPSEENLEELLTAAVAEGRPLKELSRELSAKTGLPAKEIYHKLTFLRDHP